MQWERSQNISLLFTAALEIWKFEPSYRGSALNHEKSGMERKQLFLCETTWIFCEDLKMNCSDTKWFQNLPHSDYWRQKAPNKNTGFHRNDTTYFHSDSTNISQRHNQSGNSTATKGTINHCIVSVCEQYCRHSPQNVSQRNFRGKYLIIKN